MRYFNLLILILFLTTVNASGQITVSGGGTPAVCEGATLGLMGSPAGGGWSSASPAIATVNASGIVSGIASGTTTITYTVASVDYPIVVSVNATPAPIMGAPASICVGNSVTLTSATPGGTWSSGDLGMATIGVTSGVLTGVMAGTPAVGISYVAPNTCATIVNLYVNATPAVIVGSSTVCVGSNILLTDGTSGGAWSSDAAAVAVVGASTGLVTGVSAGAAHITYTFPSGCNAVKNITVNAIPAAITGASSVCSGATVTLASTSVGGSFGATGTAFTIGASTGIVTGITAGTGVVTYSMGATGCYTTRVMTVNELPGAIIGTATVCAGGPSITTTLSNTAAGGMWISDATSVASVSGGISSTTTVTGISGGTATISYITGPGCMSTRVVTVNPAASAGVVTGSTLVCTGNTISLSSTVSGGLWNSTPTSVATVSTSGMVTGIAPGTATITYFVGTSCGTAAANVVVTVSPTPTPITGSTVFCSGTTTTLSNGVPGGTWSSSVSVIATVGATSGIVSGVAAGTATISYSLGGGCFVTTTVTSNIAPAAITGAGPLCISSILALGETTAGGVWSSGNPSVAIISTIGTSTGVVTGMSAGTAIMTYAISSCHATATVTVNALPGVSVAAVADACGGGYAMTASGGVAYSWIPSIGLSCSTCSVTNVIPAATTTYTLTGTNAEGCSSPATVTVNGNRIQGHIIFSASAPSVPDAKVWLIQYNPSDSSIAATDSVIACMDGTQPYFQFDSKPAGNYMVKAKLLSSVAGTSDYIPTYGSSTPNWYSATPILHAADANVQDINMIFGTVPSGPGFISGYVYSGAGKGTASLLPEAGMLIYLKDAITGQVLTYTYTDASGAYSFGSIGFGNYIIYPEEFRYNTTPAPVVTISPTEVSNTEISFKKHTMLHTITPYTASGIGVITQQQEEVSIFPNPATDNISIQCLKQAGIAALTIADMTGRVLVSETLTNMGAQPSKVDIAALSTGVYFISIQSDRLHYSGKLTVAK